MIKAIGLMSGGLDSTLAAMALKRQGIAVTGVAFVTPFFGAGRALKAAEQIGIPLLVREISDIHLDMVKKPVYGYGKNMNPCIDCHAMMFRLAGDIMADEGFDFLFSGEVLGQRPMSQNAQALRAVANHSGHPDRILRPLSALLLPETTMEASGMVDRSQLLAIQGRSRKPQQEHAVAWGLTEYPSSGGGCLLTEPAFSRKLKDLLEHHPAATPTDVELLKYGRQFRLPGGGLFLLGRNKEANEQLLQLAPPDYPRLHLVGKPGPTGILLGRREDELDLAASILLSYINDPGENPQIEVVTTTGKRHIDTTPLPRSESTPLQIS